MKRGEREGSLRAPTSLSFHGCLWAAVTLPPGGRTVSPEAQPALSEKTLSISDSSLSGQQQGGGGGTGGQVGGGTRVSVQ